MNEPKLNDIQCGFHPGHSIQTKIPLSSKFLRNLGVCQKLSNTYFVDLEKAYDRFLVKSFGECCGSTVLTTACYWLLSHCTPAQKFVSASGELNHGRSPWVLCFIKDACCHCISVHDLHERWPNYGPRAASGPPTNSFDPPNTLQTSFQMPRFRLATAVQQH